MKIKKTEKRTKKGGGGFKKEKTSPTEPARKRREPSTKGGTDIPAGTERR